MFLSQGKEKATQNFERNGFTIGVDKMPTKKEHNEALEGNKDLNKKVVYLCVLNELTYNDLNVAINANTLVGKVVFSLVIYEKSLRFHEILGTGLSRNVMGMLPCLCSHSRESFTTASLTW